MTYALDTAIARMSDRYYGAPVEYDVEPAKSLPPQEHDE